MTPELSIIIMPCIPLPHALDSGLLVYTWKQSRAEQNSELLKNTRLSRPHQDPSSYLGKLSKSSRSPRCPCQTQRIMSRDNQRGGRPYAFCASPSSAALEALSSPCHTASMMLMRQPLGRVTPYSKGLYVSVQEHIFRGTPALSILPVCKKKKRQPGSP